MEPTLFASILDLLYLGSVVMFVVGLRQLSSPVTARQGNINAAIGMGIAVIVALIYPVKEGSNVVLAYSLIALGMAIGSAFGWVASKRVAMTDMPQMVSAFNGLGGLCSLVIAVAQLHDYQARIDGNLMNPAFGEHLTAMLAMFIGGITFTGSMVAYLKLDGKINDKKVKIPQPTFVNLTLLLILVVGQGIKLAMPELPFSIDLLILGITLVYGITFVIPIGGADMPVVIALLNAFSGIAGALAGLVYGNIVMIVGGILVGSSGVILSVLMCNAMNRSLLNVIIGGFGSAGASAEVDGDRAVREISAADAAILLSYSRSVIIVPGYGMAVAQAQKTVHDLELLLEEKGVEVRYAIHPVAGRMPGHMNVLLAEADVPYPKLLDLDDANSALTSADVAVVVGANDVVNPAAKDDPGSPIYGMPILDILQAKNTIVIKRSMSSGYAGIDNPLFFHEKNRMLFGDAKQALQNLVNEVKGVS